MHFMMCHARHVCFDILQYDVHFFFDFSGEWDGIEGASAQLMFHSDDLYRIK